MTNEIELLDIADDLLIINKKTIDTLMELDNCADCIALYVFYYKTAKWQKTNQIKASDEYVKKCLKWGRDKIVKTKAILKEHGLIDIVQVRENGKIAGWYIKVSYMVQKRKIEDCKIISKKSSNQQVENPTSTNEEINALKEYIKCLNTEIEMLKEGKQAKSTRFVPPTLEQVQDYCRERHNGVDAQRFVDFYESKGWMVGKNKMKDWKACVRTWEKNSVKETPKKDSKLKELEDFYLNEAYE
jgi:hypothetical protein